MKKSIINLYLNEIGKKALNADIKVINANIDKENVTTQYIKDKFPLELIERYEVLDSFLSLEQGEYIVVIFPDGKKCLGKVGGTYRNQIDVTVYRPDYPWPDMRQFNPNGVEATHCKNKAHLEIANAETIANLKRALENQPFIEILNYFNNGHENIQFDPEKIVLPNWLNINVINQIKEILKEAQGFDEEDF